MTFEAKPIMSCLTTDSVKKAAETEGRVSIANSRWRWVIIAVVLLATVAAVIIGSFRPEPNLTLTNLNNVSELREQFNQDAGKIRVLLLLSPT